MSDMDEFESSRAKKTFADDMELIDFMLATGDWPFGTSDRRRCGKLERSTAYAAMKAASEARDAAYRAWVAEFGSKTQQKRLREDDEAKAYFAAKEGDLP